MKTALIDIEKLEEALEHRFVNSTPASLKFQKYIMDAIKEFIYEFVIKED